MDRFRGRVPARGGFALCCACQQAIVHYTLATETTRRRCVCFLPGSVTVAQQILVLLVGVRIPAG